MADDDANKDTQDADVTPSTLEAKVAARQAEMLGTTVSVPPTKDDPAPVETPESEVKPEVEPDPEPKPGDKQEDEVMLPAGHRRAALARGWTKEEIDHYLGTKPEEAQAAFKETFGEWQKENAEWSRRGRELKAASEVKDDAVPVKKDDAASPLSKLDAKALIEEHGSEDLINALVGPLNAMVDRLNDAAGQVAQSQEFVNDSKVKALATEAQSFLMSTEMKPFRELYGTEVRDLTDAQFETRKKLFARADDLTCGAVHHGAALSVHDALTRAHAIVSAGNRDAGIRADIRASLKKRTKTTRSTQQKAPPADAKNEPMTEAELEKATEGRLRALRDKK